MFDEPLSAMLYQRLPRPDPAVTCEWDGFVMIHRAADLPLIREVITDFKPAYAVEFGTYAGGFAAFLATVLEAWGGHVLTLDQQQDPSVQARLTKRYENLCIVETDLFGVPSNEILTWYLAQARTVLYCDNGKKIDELTRYAPQLARPGLLGTHDYGTEVLADDAEALMVSHGYQAHRHDDFAALVSLPEYPMSLTRFWLRS